MQVRFTRSARKHPIAKGRAIEALGNAEFVGSKQRSDGHWTEMYVGTDSRGVELEIVNRTFAERNRSRGPRNADPLPKGALT